MHRHQSRQQALWLWDARRVEAAHGIVERADAAALGMVGGKTDDVVLVFENAFGQGHERALGPDLDEDTRPLAVAGFDALDELDRGRHLVSQAPPDGVHVMGRIQIPVDVAHQGNARKGDLHFADGPVERVGGWGHHLAVEGVGDRDELRGHAQLVEVLDRAVHRITGTRDDRLLAAVDVGRREIATDLGQPAHDLVGGPHHRGHLALVTDGHRSHGARARAHRHQGFGEGDHAGSHGRGPLAQAVPHHDIGLDPMFVEQAHNGDVAGHHGGLANGGVFQRLFRRLHGSRIGLVLVDVFSQRLAKDRPHHAIGLGEGLAHDRVW